MWGGVIIALILWYSFAWDSLWTEKGEVEKTYELNEKKIERLEKNLKHYKKLSSESQTVRKELEARRKELITGDTAERVAQNMQTSVVKLASEVGLDIVTYKTSSSRSWKGHKLPVVNFTFKASTEKLARFLMALEEKFPSIRIRTINLTSGMGRNPHRITVTMEALYLQKAKKG